MRPLSRHHHSELWQRPEPKQPDEPSITHQEIQKAITLKKPRWLLAHDHVVFARLLLNNLGFKGRDDRRSSKIRKTPILDDLRVLDLYEDATIDFPDVGLDERDGNWVQKFRTTEDGSLFVVAQFFRYQEVEQFIKENFQGRLAAAQAGR